MFAKFATAAIVCLAVGQAPDSLQKYREEIVKGINELRAAKKVAPLVRNVKLEAAAQKHAANMAKQDKYGDDGKNGHILDGRGPVERVAAEDYDYADLAETVTASVGKQASAAIAVKKWKSSAPHYKGLTTDTFTETGAGAAQGKSGKWYYCQVLAKPKQ
jgi:uncharacterized protein YkwD